MANRFLSNIKINDSYTLPSADGTNGQIISTDGSGNLSFIDNTGDNTRSIVFTVKNISGGNLTKGTVVHASPSATPPSGNVIEVIKADNDVSGSMPAIGVLNETLADDAEGDCVMMGSVSGIDTSAFNVGDELYVDSSPGAFTATKPTGTSNLIQKIGIVIKSHASNGLIEVFGAGRTNDVPNLVDRTINFADNAQLRIGDDSDLKIYHNGTNSFIENETGNLYIFNKADDKDIIFSSDNGSGGTATYITIDGSDVITKIHKNFRYLDNVKANFGNGDDLQIYHDGTHSYIDDAGVGNLRLRGNAGVQIMKAASTELMGEFIADGAAKLYYDNSLKFETTSSGIAVTGDADVSGTVYVGGNNSLFAENNLRFKSAGAAYIDHNTVGQSFVFRTSSSSSLDTTALTIESDADVTFYNNIDINGNNKHIRFIDTYGNWMIEVGDGANNFKIHSQSLAADYLTIDGSGNTTIAGNLTVSGTGQSSFAGQVTVPATPSASTDAASKGYVDSQVGANNELSEVLSNGNTTGGTDISVSANDDITFADSSKSIYGAGSDLQIYHDGSNSYINETGTGVLSIQSDGTEVQINKGASEYMARFITDAGVKLYYDNSLKFETLTDGAKVLGEFYIDEYITHTGDGNTKFGFPSADNFSVTTSGTERMRINSSGDVSIADGDLEFSAATGNHTIYVADYTGDDYFNADRGNIEIKASSSPNSGNNAKSGGRVLITAGNSYNGQTGDIVLSTGANHLNASDNGLIRFNIGGTASSNEKMRIDSNGVLQLTTTSASGFVNANSTALELDVNRNPETGTFGDTNKSHARIQLAGDNGGSNIKFNTASANNTTATERMRIDSSGNVLLTSNGDATQLQIRRASASQDNGLQLQDQNGNKHAIFNLEGTTTNNLQIGASNQMIFYTSSSLGNPPTAERFRITGQGRLGVNTSSPSEMFSVASGNVAITNGNSFMVGGANGDTIVGRLKNTSGVLNLEGDSTRSIRFGSVTNGEVVRIDNVNNRVGIGTSSPSANLHISSTGDAILKIEADTDNVTEGDNPEIHLIQDGGATEARIGLAATNNEAYFWQYQSNDIKFGTNNTERMRIENTGDVCIGTTSHEGKFTVVGATQTCNFDLDANAEVGLSIMGVHSSNFVGMTIGSANSTKNSGVFRFKYNGAGSNNNYVGIGLYAADDILNVTGGGKVGIGTTSPSAKLDIAQGSASPVALEINTENTFCDVLMNSYYSTSATRLRVGTNDFQIHTNGSQNLTVTSGGNVGIGETSPDNKLHIKGGSVTRLKIESSGSNTGVLLTENGSDKWSVASVSGGAFQLYSEAANTTRFAIDTSGNVRIGGGSHYTGTGITSLTVNNNLYPTFALGSTTGNRYAMIAYSSAIHSYSTSAPFLYSIGGAEKMRIETNGNVGIGTTSPTYKFHVASSNNVSIFEDTSGSSGATFCLFNAPSVFAMGSITRNGSATSVLFNTSSDYRLKEDLQDFNALDLVDNITAYDYKWKDTEQRDYGFVAHELQEVMPNVVSGEKDGEEMQKVDYSKLTPVLLKAIQEQQEIINNLKSRIEILENN